MHRVVFKPSFVAEARKIGWRAAAEEFRRRCLELAPRPQADAHGEVLPLESRRA
jgi:hypothetical protein